MGDGEKTEDTKSTMTEVISGAQDNIMFLHFVLSCHNIAYRWRLQTTIWTRIFAYYLPQGWGGDFSLGGNATCLARICVPYTELLPVVSS